jgi:spectinomycin phosphotransferase
VSVYPFLSGTSYPFGVHVDAGRRREVLEMMIAIHASTPVLPALPPDHQPTFGGRRDLDAALADPGRPWDGGPYSQRAHALVASQAAGLRAVVDAFDRLVDRTTAARSRSVVTHGEPHAGNVMWAGGNVWLIDWDTVGLGPPERDLWWLVEDADEAARYAAATGQAVNPEVMTLYRLRWYLDDIAQAVRLFAGQHLRTADTQRWWEGFPPRIGALDSWRERLGA